MLTIIAAIFLVLHGLVQLLYASQSGRPFELRPRRAPVRLIMAVLETAGVKPHVYVQRFFWRWQLSFLWQGSLIQSFIFLDFLI